MLNSNNVLKLRLLAGSAATALIAISAQTATAQTVTNQTETVIVTGTNIRGAAPVGANVITMDASQIEATGAVTTQDLLTNIPSLSGFGNQGAGTDARGGLGTADASGSSSPNIHSIGASSSSQTLILIDGHHVPLSGLSHTLVDPSIIAPDAIERVDVLPDGASAVYGSDASAGVINIITKKKYSGLNVSLQYGGAADYSNAAVGLSFGHSWDTGAAMVAYDYSENSRLMVSDRSYLSSNLVSRGGYDGNSLNCAPATIAKNSSANPYYVYPYTGASPGTTAPAIGTVGTAPCDNSGYGSLLPSAVRHNMLASLTQQFGDRLTASVDLGFSDHVIATPVSRGTLSATAYGTAPATGVGVNQVNPFYQSGTTGLTNSEYVRYDFNQLFGPGAYTKGGQLDVFVAGGLDYDLFGDWVATLSGTAGVDISTSKSRGTVCSTCAYLAINGTTNANGTNASSSADAFGLGETVYATRAVTTSTALDVWNPAGSNKTSATVLSQLLDNTSANATQQDLNDLQLQASGSLFDLPAGAVKTVFGAEYLMNNLNSANVRDNIFGTVNTTVPNFKANRTNWAQFIEFRIPVVSPDMNIPLIQRFDLDIAGRHDHYSTFGDTENPKVSFSWTVVDGLKATGSYGTSFVAPALTALPVAYSSNVGPSTSSQAILPNHVNAPGSFCAAGCTLSGYNGLTITGANNSGPETSTTYNFGLTLDPGRWTDALTGLHLQVSYWQNKSKGLITSPTLANEAQVPGLESQLLLAPPGGYTAAQLAPLIAGYPQTGVITGPIYWIYHNVQQNAFDILANGLDFDVSYTLPTPTWGDFTLDLAGSDKLRFDEQSFGGASTRYLNGYNVNTTFSSLALTGRLSLNWHLDPITLNVAVNYVNPYLFQTSNYPNYVAGAPINFQHVHASYPVDLHASYDLPSDMSGWSGDLAKGTSVALTINNIFDQKPPFYDSGLGYDPDNGSPVGRLVLFSLHKKF